LKERFNPIRRLCYLARYTHEQTLEVEDDKKI
jgi:hypothetical protein